MTKRYRYTADQSAADKAREQYEYEWIAQGPAEYAGPDCAAEDPRDYKAEAISIAEGDSVILAERGHIIALYHELLAVRKTNAHVAEPFRTVLNTILNTAKKEIA